MKILRATFHAPNLEPGPTVVLREPDLKCSIEEAARGCIQPGAYCTTEVFDLAGNPSIAEASLVVEQRRARVAQRERDEALLYYWTIMSLRRVNSGGVLCTTKPAPFSADRIRYVLAQICAHPEYRGQQFRIVAPDEPDGFVSWPEPAAAGPGAGGFVNP